MPMTREEMDRKVDEHFRYEGSDDVQGVLATLSADVEHDVVGWPGGATRGRANAKAFLKENPDMADAIEAQIREKAGLPLAPGVTAAAKPPAKPTKSDVPAGVDPVTGEVLKA